MHTFQSCGMYMECLGFMSSQLCVRVSPMQLLLLLLQPNANPWCSHFSVSLYSRALLRCGVGGLKRGTAVSSLSLSPMLSFDGSTAIASPRSWRGISMDDDLTRLREVASYHVPPVRSITGVELTVHKSLANRAIDGLHGVNLPQSWHGQSFAPCTRTELHKRRAAEQLQAEHNTFSPRAPLFSPRDFNLYMKSSVQLQNAIESPVGVALLPGASPREGYTRTLLMQRRKEQAIAEQEHSKQTQYEPQNFI